MTSDSIANPTVARKNHAPPAPPAPRACRHTPNMETPILEDPALNVIPRRPVIRYCAEEGALVVGRIFRKVATR